jgi:hypothetical protein
VDRFESPPSNFEARNRVHLFGYGANVRARLAVGSQPIGERSLLWLRERHQQAAARQIKSDEACCTIGRKERLSDGRLDFRDQLFRV